MTSNGESSLNELILYYFDPKLGSLQVEISVNEKD